MTACLPSLTFILPDPRLAPFPPLFKEQIGTDPASKYQGTEVETCCLTPGATFVGQLCYKLWNAMTTFADYINKVFHLNNSNNIVMHKWKKLKNKKNHLIDASASRDNPGMPADLSPGMNIPLLAGGSNTWSFGTFSRYQHTMTTSGHRTQLPTLSELNCSAESHGCAVQSLGMYIWIIASFCCFITALNLCRCSDFSHV